MPRMALMRREKRVQPGYFLFGAADFPAASFSGGLAWAKSEAASDFAALLLVQFPAHAGVGVAKGSGTVL